MSTRLRKVRWRAVTALVSAALAVPLLAVPGSSLSPNAQADPAAVPAGQVRAVNACGTAAAGQAGCELHLLADSAGRALTPAAVEAADVAPFTAADLQDAYHLPSALLGARQTIAVVVPFDHPRAAEDLAVYREANNLPECTSAFPCLRKVNQRGGSELPPASLSWSLVMSAGLQMASAACPNCHLLVVEADNAVPEQLGAAVDQAVAQGADVVVTPYTYPEHAAITDDVAHYTHPGVPIVAPTATVGFPSPGLQRAPAVFPDVIAVGGTTLRRDNSSRGWFEQAWSGSTSGCSAYLPKPRWQDDRLCENRTVTDVAAVGDPITPVAIYHTFGQDGWLAVNSTSVGAALVAGVYALAGNADTIAPGRHLYRHRRDLFDVTSGSTGECGGSYLCTAVRGYDGPTGLGTPNGIGAF